MLADMVSFGKIWSLQIPNKLKTFAWRASRNILPTKVNLCSRGVLDDPTCDACGLIAETNRHLFWDCRHAREVWTTIGIPFDSMGVHYRDFIDLIWYLISRQHMGQDVLELIITIAWCMWYNRNRARHGSPRQSSNDPTQSSHHHRGFPGGSLRVSLTHGSIRHSLGSSFKSVVQGKHRRSYLQESQHSGPCRNGHRSPQSASTLAVRSLGG